MEQPQKPDVHLSIGDVSSSIWRRTLSSYTDPIDDMPTQIFHDRRTRNFYRLLVCSSKTKLSLDTNFNVLWAYINTQLCGQRCNGVKKTRQRRQPMASSVLLNTPISVGQPRSLLVQTVMLGLETWSRSRDQKTVVSVSVS
jgi:hypothetical protein